MLTSLMVTLTRANVQPPPPYQITLKCPYCPEQFHLNYTDSEWNCVNSMVKAAEKAIREDHKTRHEPEAIDMKWKRL